MEKRLTILPAFFYHFFQALFGVTVYSKYDAVDDGGVGLLFSHGLMAFLCVLLYVLAADCKKLK